MNRIELATSLKVRGVLICAAAAVALASIAGTVRGGSKAGLKSPRSLTILYTSQAQGQVRSCNCSKFRYGGYGRQDVLVAAVRKETPNVVLLEGGDFVGPTHVGQDAIKADIAAQAIGLIRYSTVVPGESEIDYGVDNLKKLQATAKAPFVAANVTVRATGKPLFEKPYIITTTAAGVRVGVTGLLAASTLSRLPGVEVDVADPRTVLKKLLPKIRAAADVVVVVSHSGMDQARSLALPGVSVVLCTHSGDKLPRLAKNVNVIDAPTEKVGNCLVVKSSSGRNWNVGRLDLGVGPGSQVVESKLFYLDRSFAESPEMVKIYDVYNKRVRDLALKQNQDARAKFDTVLIRRGIDPTSHRRAKIFAGFAACGSCHEKASQVWSGSAHAKAFATLKKTNQEFDPECVTCHTTGAKVRGGFTDAEQTPDYVNVQCEACHGPAIGHTAKPEAGFGQIGEDYCRGCHTDELSPDFDYEVMWKKIAH